MTQRQELDLILKLINKYHLPISPILEYAIKEKMEECPKELESREIPQTYKKSREIATNKNEKTITDDLEIEHVYLDSRGKILKTTSVALNVNNESTSAEDGRRWKAWTKEEERLVKQYFQQGKDFNIIAEHIGRTEGAIKARLAKLGLIDYIYGQEDRVNSDITQRPFYLERKQAILRALRFLRLPASIKNISKMISRTSWGGAIKEEDVEEILSTMSEVDSVDGNFFIRNR